MRRTVIAVVAIAAALLGPRFTAPHDRAAGAVFAFDPPDGFTAKPASATEPAELEWAHAPTPGHVLPAQVTLKRLPKRGNVETSDLTVIADGMPAALAKGGVSWTTIRQETRTRADGARVGLIEGESTRTSPEPAAGGGGGAELPLQPPLTYRQLLLVFPTDDGTALATAQYAKDETSTWQPAFETTIGTAHGVALRVPPPPSWLYGAWALAGLVLSWLGVSLLAKRREAAREPG